jgi:hypothetical protein
MTNTVNDILNPVLSFLETHSLAELRETHGIRYNVKGHLVTLAYDQFEAKIDNNVSNLCRGLVIAREDGSSAIDVNSVPFGKAVVLAFPFIRFFNYGQGDSHKALDAFKIRSVMEKLDGCAHESTIITTNKGPKTIKELCENQEYATVLSYNTGSKQLEWDQIVGHSIQNNIDNWYEIFLENGEKLLLTGNHMIWCDNLNCYRAVEDLDGTEILFHFA